MTVNELKASLNCIPERFGDNELYVQINQPGENLEADDKFLKGFLEGICTTVPLVKKMAHDKIDLFIFLEPEEYVDGGLTDTNIGGNNPQ